MKKNLLFCFALSIIAGGAFAQTPSLIKDIYTGINGSNTSLYGVPYGTGIVFAANDGVNGNEVWFSDASTAGTAMIKDIYSGSLSSSPAGFFLYNSKVLFSAVDATGNELWITDATLGGTSQVKDINPGVNGSSPGGFVQLGTKVLFLATTASEGTELWITDGTPGGTSLVKDIWPGTASSAITKITDSGLGYVYFIANDGVAGGELWRSDGTTAGTYMIKDIYSGSGSSLIQMYEITGGLLYFLADDGPDGAELWRSDGTNAGTFLTKDLYPGNTGINITQYAAYNNKFFYFAMDPANGWEPRESDGTTAGTIVNDLTPGTSDTYLNSNFYPFSGNMFFFRQKVTSLKDTMCLYKLTNTVSNLSVVKEFSNSSTSGLTFYVSFVQTDNSKFVGIPNPTGCTGTSPSYFVVSDGTTAGSSLVTNSVTCITSVPSIPFLNNNWIFPVATGTTVAGNYELNNIDHTTGAVSLIKDLNTTSSFINSGPGPAGLSWTYRTYYLNNKYYFIANDGNTGNELYVTDGTNGGTNMTLDIYPGSNSGPVSSAGDFKAIVTSNNIFFYANNGSTGPELWAFLLATGIEENHGALFGNMFLFPNPSHESINFNLSADYFKESKVDYVIYNSLGQECAKGRLSDNKLNISSFAQGLYTISLSTSGKSTVLKFVKE